MIMNILDTTVQAPLDYTPSESVWEAVMAEGGDKKEEVCISLYRYVLYTVKVG